MEKEQKMNFIQFKFKSILKIFSSEKIRLIEIIFKEGIFYRIYQSMF